MIELKQKLVAAALAALILIIPGCKTVDVSSELKEADLTVIMYHSFLKDTAQSGKYVITPSQFENDIIYLKSIGCSFVSVKDIENFRQAKGSLPDKAVLITIDDGNYNNYTYIYPLLIKHSVPALISPICYWVEKYNESKDQNPIYAIMTSDNIREMHASGFVEFGNHTYNLHSMDTRFGTCKNPDESTENYRQMLYEDLKKADEIIKNATGEKPCALVYPYGMISPESYDVAQRLGYSILFSCTEGINHIHPGDNRYLLKRYNRPSGTDSSTFFGKIFSQADGILK